MNFPDALVTVGAEVAARLRPFHVREPGRGELLRRDASDGVVDAGRAREERQAELGQRGAAHFGKPHLQQDLWCRRRRLYLQQRDHVGFRVDESRREVDGPLGDFLAADVARQDHVLAVAADVDRFPGQQLLHVGVQPREVALHGDLVALDRRRRDPTRTSRSSGHLGVDQQLVRRRHHRVGDVGARQRDARDRRADLDDRRSADEHAQIPDGAVDGGGIDRRRTRAGGRRLDLRVDRAPAAEDADQKDENQGASAVHDAWLLPHNFLGAFIASNDFHGRQCRRRRATAAPPAPGAARCARRGAELVPPIPSAPPA